MCVNAFPRTPSSVPTASSFVLMVFILRSERDEEAVFHKGLTN